MTDGIIGGVYRPRPVDEEPDAILTRWRVYEVSVPGTPVTRHFVGHNLITGDGRVSSPIQSWAVIKREGITASGRRYRLEGPYGTGMDSQYVFGVWCLRNRIDKDDLRDVSQEYEDG